MDTHDILSAQAVSRLLDEGSFIKPQVFDSITSTNTYLVKLAAEGAPEGTAIIAAEQTAGRGRKGKSFYSPRQSGLYMSLLLRPKMDARTAIRITTCGAVAVCEGVEELSGKKTGIKWVNDVLTGPRKICGILTEGAADESGGLLYAVIGIGINIYRPGEGFPTELSDVAGYVFEEEQIDGRNRLAAAVLNGFARRYADLGNGSFMNEYRSRCIVLGRRVTVLLPSGSREALAVGLDDECGLIVRYDDDSTQVLSSGEISVKL